MFTVLLRPATVVETTSEGLSYTERIPDKFPQRLSGALRRTLPFSAFSSTAALAVFPDDNPMKHVFKFCI